MYSTSYIELSRSALETNIAFIRSALKSKDTQISAVIKGHAYGHGIEDFLPLAEECGLNHFSVFSADEALIAKRVMKSDSTLVIMGMIDNEELEWAVANDIEFFVFELDRLHHARNAAQKVGKPAKIHIEAETGMNRTGIDENDLSCTINFIKDNANMLDMVGLCTHFAGAESLSNYYRIINQIERYDTISKLFEDMGLTPRYFHTASSAATLNYPATQFDLVRVGILNYGFWPNQETYIRYMNEKGIKIDPLRRLLSWKSRIMSVKEVLSGDFIGYGHDTFAPREMKIAVVPVGYSHGYSRSLSNTGRVLIDETICNVLGFVNMNMILIDVTDVIDVKKGDEVVLIGHQGHHDISVASFSEFSNQLNYELLTRLPLDIPRVIVD
jgi:alanine racemase